MINNSNTITYGYLKDAHGNRSSKRLHGSMLIIAGIIELAVLIAFSLFAIAKDSSIILKAAEVQICLGAGLLGAGIFEGICDKSKKKSSE